MRYRFCLTVVFVLVLTAQQGKCESITLPGLPFFDTSLGVLQKATVTLDPGTKLVDLYGIIGSNQPIAEHQHLVTIPPLYLLPREIVFPSVLTNLESAPASAAHSHSFDPPPVVHIYEDADLSYFIFDGTFSHVDGTFVDAGITSVAEGHSHSVGSIFIGGSTEFTTTFDYAAVPEPATGLIAGIFAGVFLSRHRSSRPVPRNTTIHAHEGLTLAAKRAATRAPPVSQ